MTTLREDVAREIFDGSFSPSLRVIGRIADLLEATGAPAYMRVAKDLRGEWEPDATADVTPA